MSRALSVVLAVCCVLSMGIAGLPTTDTPSSADRAAPASPATCSVDDPNVGCVENGSNYLSLNGSDVITVSANDSSLDVATAVATDVSATSARLTRESIAAAYETAPRDSRRAVIEGFESDLRNATDDLRDRERATLRAYNDGRLSGEEYLKELAEIDAKADRLWSVGDFINVRYGGQTAETLADLYGLRGGPVRNRLAQVYAGDRSSLRVHVTTTDSGFALGAFVDDRIGPAFASETYLGDVRRRSSGPDRYDGNAGRALNRLGELYPWVFSARDASVSGKPDVYRATRTHSQGSTVVFLDGQSGRVFAEHSTASLDRTPTVYTNETNVSSGLTVSLGRTHRGGPLNVTVTDISGQRVPATVTVNGRQVGQTGDDGMLWTVTPYRANLVVTAEHRGETVTIIRYGGN
ncbi:DUF7096 domain-containing protein [Halomarina rubra]|uniref:Uncharacterized protein n=1 Tax=Halomarina rubra TaxID=2071873 RepID=A0ABD6ATP7_9EURY|nr:hypothetical protein [Halomarina rubra]